MNPIRFFNAHFGRHLVPQTGDELADATHALSSGHAMAKGGSAQRIASGWAVIKPAHSTLQFKLAAAGLHYSEQTRYDAWLDALTAFAPGDELMLLEFDKRPIPVNHLHRTLDLRAVHICGPSGVQVFNWLKSPGPEAASAHKILEKVRQRREESSTNQ